MCVRFYREMNSDTWLPLLFPFGFYTAFSPLCYGLQESLRDYVERSKTRKDNPKAKYHKGQIN